jgi:hypothetical protein
LSVAPPSRFDPCLAALGASELQLLADASLDLAVKYERNAGLLDNEDEQQLARALAKWRRERARYFRELSAEAERLEAPYHCWYRNEPQSIK